jgi:magnesium chelatase family protein
MSNLVQSGTLLGIEGIPVHVEVDLLRRLPSITIVGLPGSAVRESADRVRSALQQSGFDFPKKRVVINLAPAGLKKNGAAFDLPIAMGILAAMNKIPQQAFHDALFVGELSLSGSIRPIQGALSLTMMAKKQGLKRIFIPHANAQEASVVPDIEIFPVHTLLEATQLCIQRKSSYTPKDQSNPEKRYLDLQEVRGQHRCKRALEIAASGGHNLLMMGSPGCGKTMMALRLPSILPTPSFEEALEITRIHSASGQNTECGLIQTRPFRAPHHSISTSGMIGNAQLLPGEASLAHNGVLFLDEFPEFRRDVLEALRAPIEDRQVRLVRAQGQVFFPSNFSLIAASNPCPCGYFGHPTQACRCTPRQLQHYQNKLSGPLFDRMDMHIWVEPVHVDSLLYTNKEEPSNQIRARVTKARKIQEQRFSGMPIFCNAQLSGSQIEEHTPLNPKSKEVLHHAMKQKHLSARAWSKIRKISRSIADLEESTSIQPYHVQEAIQYRLPLGGVA